MIKEAEENAEADKIKREKIDTLNEANNLIFQTKKSLDTLKDEIQPEEKNKIEGQIKDLEEALKTEDIAIIKEKMSLLEKESQSIAVKAYQKAQEKSKENSDNDNYKPENDKNSDPDEVVDAEFKEKK